MPKITVTNTAKGLRGLHAVTGFVEIAPGATETVEVTDGELASVKSVDYFTLKGVSKEAPAADADDLDTTVPRLKEIAAAEGVELPHNATKADIQAAIRAKRDAPAEPASDGLDNTSDEELREIVTSLTGAEPAADATRDDLLALARATG